MMMSMTDVEDDNDDGDSGVVDNNISGVTMMTMMFLVLSIYDEDSGIDNDDRDLLAIMMTMIGIIIHSYTHMSMITL